MDNIEIEYPFQFYFRTIVQLMKRTADVQLSPHNISGSQARIIGFIGENQKSGKSTCQKDVEKEMGIKGPSVTSLLQGLEKKGFIKRSRSLVDDRIKELSLTTKGGDLVNSFKKLFTETECKISKGLTDDQKRNLLEILVQISKNLEN